MANYTVSEKTKTIYVSDILSPVEQQIVAMHIGEGYKVVEKSHKRLNEKEIENWFKKKKIEDGYEKFVAEKEKPRIDKNGKERKSGYLLALKWFRKTYPEAVDEILGKKKTSTKNKSK